MTDPSFTAFLAYARLVKGMSDTPFEGKKFNIHWSLWIDPGKHTGLAAVIYATPLAGSDETAITLAERLDKTIVSLNVAPSPRGIGLPGDQVPGAPGAVGAVVMGMWTELLFDPSENYMVRQAISRVRDIGKAFAGTMSWDATSGAEMGTFGIDEGDPHIGTAGIGAESFILLKPERDPEYLSPVRIRSAFSYALEDEFAILMRDQMPGDAKNTFSDDRLRRAGLYIKGSDHPRDALRHTLLAIRKAELA